MTAKNAIDVLQVDATHAHALCRFFELLQVRGVEKYFHPHPLTAQSACERAQYLGKDVYLILFSAGEILGYGMLRGWDEGYAIPSLGVVVHPDLQGQGLGRRLMENLQTVAMERGASKIRLRVSPENHGAVKLYRSLGYDLHPDEDSPYLLGYLDLSPKCL